MPEREQGAATELHRLAEVAHERGLRLFRDADGRWLCTSASQPEAIHYLTALSCDCRGFIQRQRCSHLALLLETLGWLPAVEHAPAPMVSTSRPCPDCTGTGLVYVRDCARAGWPFPPCEACHGTGIASDLPAATARAA